MFHNIIAHGKYEDLKIFLTEHDIQRIVWLLVQGIFDIMSLNVEYQ